MLNRNNQRVSDDICTNCHAHQGDKKGMVFVTNLIDITLCGDCIGEFQQEYIRYSREVSSGVFKRKLKAI